MLRRILSQIKRALARQRRRLNPINSAELQRALAELIKHKSHVLFVHSSLSACGHISGGPATAINVLHQLSSTLVLPSHTYCYPAATESCGAIFDRAVTPSLVGAISDWFWRQPSVIRSLHPTHSVAASGPLAATICANHESTDTPCGAGTPYETLLHNRSAVLMFGCTLNTYTLFHTSEHFAKCPYLYYPQKVSLQFRDTDGQVRPMSMWRQNMEFARRFSDMDVELAQAGLLESSVLRQGKLLYIPDAQSVHAYLMERMAQNPNYLLKTT